MAEGMFGFGAMGSMPDQAKPDPAQRRRLIETSASQHQVPANVLMALDEAGISDFDTAAQKIAADMKGGKTVDQIVGADLMNRAYDIADKMYPRQPAPVAPDRPKEANMLRDIPAAVGASVASAAGRVGRGLGEGLSIATDAINDNILDPFTEGFTGRKPDQAGSKSENILAGPSEYLSGKDGLSGFLDSFVSSEVKQDMADLTDPDADLFSPKTWKMGARPTVRGAIYSAVDVFGSMAPVVIVGVITRSPAAAAAAGASMSAGDAAQNAEQVIDGMAANKLPDGRSQLEAESSVYQRLISEGRTPAQALQITKRRAEQQSAMFAAIPGALGGAATQKILSGAEGLVSKLPWAGRVAGTAAMSGLEEGTQEVAEGIAGSAGINSGAGVDQSLTAGSLNDFALGAMGGAPMGAIGGAFSRQEQNTVGDGSASGQEAAPAMGLPGPDAGAASANIPPPGPGPVAPIVPTGPIGRAAALAPDLTPQPEAPPPQQFFPDQKPGSAIKLYDPESEVTHNAVFLGEGPDGVSVRVNGEEIVLNPQEFDQARNDAMRIETEEKAAAKEATKSGKTAAPKPTAPLVFNVPEDEDVSSAVPPVNPWDEESLNAAAPLPVTAISGVPNAASDVSTPSNSDVAGTRGSDAGSGGVNPPDVGQATVGNDLDGYGLPRGPGSNADVPVTATSSEPDGSLTETVEPVRNQPRDVEFLNQSDVQSVQTDAHTFQYKDGGDSNGVTDSLRGVSKWDTARAGMSLIYEYADGRRVVADGHQRLGLAKRLGATGQDIRLPAIILREADGITPRAARTTAALKNIAEGSGTAIDAAKVLRDTDQNAGQLGLPPNSALVRDATGLQNLSDQAFGMVVNGTSSESSGGIVGRLVVDKGVQANILGLLNRLKPANAFQAESIVRQAMDATSTETQTSLFGDEDVQTSLYLERAKILDIANKRITGDIKGFKTVIDRAESLSSEGNVLNASANQQRLASDAVVRDYLGSQANMKGPISDALTNAARAYKEHKSLGAAADAFLAAVQRGLVASGGNRSKGDQVGQGVGRASAPQQGAAGSVTAEPTKVGLQTVIPGAERNATASEAARLPEKKAISDVRAAQSKMGTTAPQADAGPLFGDDTVDLFAPPTKVEITTETAKPAVSEFGPNNEGIKIGGLDEAIANRAGTLTVTENGVPVPFKVFALAVEGKTAEVGNVERTKSARAGIGFDAYVALGQALAEKGITLQSTPTLLKDGRKLWEKLEKQGHAQYNPQTKRVEFVKKAEQATPAAVPVSAPAAPSATKPSPKAARAARDTQIGAYFTPGNIVPSYGGGHDRVVAFERDKDGGPKVTVESVVKDGDKWVKNSSDMRVRSHGTTPSERELRAGPVDREQQPVVAEKPAPVPTAAEIDTAAAEADKNPTDAQKEASNYKMAHVAWNGLNITIETPKGALRKGKDADGNEWSVKLPAHYGYLKRSEGADGDHLDIYMGDNPDSDVVVVVDQVDSETKKFDETKTMLGFTNRKTALDYYVQGFSDGKGADRMGAHKVMSVAEFKDWVANGDTTKPVRLDAQEATADVKQAPAAARGPVQNFRDAYARNGMKDMAGNPDLADIVAYGDWLGQLTDDQWKMLEDAKAFTREMNPFLNRISLDIEAEKAGIEAIIKPAAGPAKSAAKIADFGEKLDGAAKDRWKGFAKRLGDVPDSDVANHPLSKSWPEPNYAALVEDGADPWSVAFIRAARQHVPRKPQGWKLKGWVEAVKLLRTFSRDLLDGAIDPQGIRDRLEQPSMARLRSDIMGAVDLYLALGHESDLTGIKLQHSTPYLSDGKMTETRYEVIGPAARTGLSNWPKVLAFGATKEAAIGAFKATGVDAVADAAKAKSGPDFLIYSAKPKGGEAYVFIAVKIAGKPVEVQRFKTSQEARDFRTNNRADLEKRLAAMKDVPRERREINSERIGDDHRLGADVTPEAFEQSFGFRGVQFGNYVEGARRQQDLNQAYDALMDLAGIIGIPPKAISLNGQMGLAFGARGRGGKTPAKAHYEPNNVVINLTKEKGAGSLAHEWFHAVDNYFERSRGRPVEYVTSNPAPRKVGEATDVRPEVLQAFADLREALRATKLKSRSAVIDRMRSTPYWSTGIEMHARAFESYVIAKLRDQDAANDYLANIVSEPYWKAAAALQGLEGDSYPYLIAEEEPAVRAAFDKLFTVIETRDTDRGVEMYSRFPEGQEPADMDSAFAAEIMAELAMVDDLFQNPRTAAKTLKGVFAEVDPSVKFVGKVRDLDDAGNPIDQDKTLLRTAEGEDRPAYDFYVYQTDNDVWIDVSNLKSGTAGSRIYAAVADYALNTSRVFIGDPEGLSLKALRRRTDAMLSSALKHGTTKHLAPHEYQLTGDAARKVQPLVWTEGNDVANVSSLIEVSVANAIHLIPEIAESTYDFDSGTFRDAYGEPLSNEVLDGWASEPDGVRAARTGRNTIKRGILLNTLAHAKSGQRPGLLERALRQSGALVARGLRDTFYSRGEPSAEPVATLTGDELGAWEDMRQLGKKAEAWYRNNLVGQKVTNTDTGWSIGFTNRGAKKIGSRKGDDLFRMVPALREIVEKGRVVASEPDSKGRPEIKAIHKIAATVMLDGVAKDVVATIRETNEGSFHYDLGKDVSDGARFSRLEDGNTAVRMSDAQVRSPALEGDSVEINLDHASREINESAQAIPVASLRVISEALAAEVKTSGLAGTVSSILVRRLLDRNGIPIQGRQSGARIEVSAESADPVGVMRHEIVHALRDEGLWAAPYGLFTGAEWRTLVAAARADAGIMARVREAYSDKSEAVQIEEAVAEMYREWAGARDAAGPVSRIFGKIKAFFEGMARALRGEGFADAAMVMERIAGGTVGGRGPDGGSGKSARGDMERRSTSTPEFAKWFGNSKAVGADGKPLLVYHATFAEFDAFDTKAKSGDQWFGQGSYFATSEGALGEHIGMAFNPGETRVVKAYLSIQNPYIWDVSTPAKTAKLRTDLAAAGVDMAAEFNGETLQWAGSEKFTTWAKSKGYDGVFSLDYDGNQKPVEIVAFYPEQIKSTDNNGAFDGENPNMKELRGGLIKAQDKFKGLVGSAHWKNPGALVSNTVTDAMVGGNGYNALALVPGRALFAELGKYLPAAKAYLRQKEEMDSVRNDWHARADAVAQRWLAASNKNPEAHNKLGELMHRSTLTGIDPSQPDTRVHAMDAGARREIAEEGDAARDWAKDTMRQIEAHESSFAKLKAEYDALPLEFRQIYRTVKSGYDMMGQAFEAAILQNIQNATRVGLKRAVRAHEKEITRIRDEGLEGVELDEAIASADAKLKAIKMRGGFAAKARLAAMRKKFESNRLKGPYFPLARFGEYFVTVRDATGKVTSFSKFEKESQQQAFIREMKEQGETKIEFGTMDDAQKLRSQIDPSFVADIENMLAEAGAGDEVMDAVWQRWLETLPDRSIRTSNIHRKGTTGYSRDAFRAFGKQMFHGGHQLAKLEHGLLMEEHLNDATEQAKVADNPNRALQVVAEMKKRHDFAMNPKGNKFVALMSNAAFVWYLGATPAAALANMTQTTVVGIPLMSARFSKAGVLGVTKELGKASKDFVAGRGKVSNRVAGVPVWTDQWTAENSPNLSGDEKSALAEAVRRGTIDKTQAHDLASAAEHGIEYNATREKWMRRIGFFFHHAERFNREVTFLASYRLAKADGLDHVAAADAAGDLTFKIHFDMQNNSRPRFMQNDVGKVLTTFRQFTVNMLWRLFRDTHQALNGATKEDRREARLQLVGLTLSMMAHAGIRGVWGYGLLMMLLGMLAPGADDDDIKEWLQEALLMQGDSAGVAAWNFTMGAALNGVPGQILGVDLTDRIGMPNLWFREARNDLEGSDLYTHYIMELLGPAAGVGGGFFRGAQLAADGEWWRGVESAVPKAIRDGMKSARYVTEGVNTLKGDSLIDAVSPYQAIVQAIGFTPAEISERYDINSRLKDREAQVTDERSGIQKAAAKAILEGEGIPADILAQIGDFNSRYPEYPITGESIKTSARSKMRASDRSEFGIILNPRLNDRLRAERATPIGR